MGVLKSPRSPKRVAGNVKNAEPTRGSCEAPTGEWDRVKGLILSLTLTGDGVNWFHCA
jgi:hypothetical protein